MLRWAWRLVLAVLLALGAAAAVRTWTVSTAVPLAGEAIVVPPELDEELLARRLAGFLRIRGDDAEPGATGALREAAAAFLRREFPLTTALAVDYGGSSLLFVWPGRSASARPVALLAHLDTVVVPSSDAGRWTHAPSAGAVAGGFVWGRGALDDRTSALAILEAVEGLLRQEVVPSRTVYIALGVDEERGGEGARELAAWLRARHPRGLALVLGEGGFITEGLLAGIAAPVALVGVAEKAHATLTLSVSGASGHAAARASGSAVTRLAEAIVRLEHAGGPPVLRGPSAWMAEALAPALSLPSRVLFANLWLFRPAVARLVASDPRLAPFTRTTIAATRITAGAADNVVPPEAAATLDVRLLPGDTLEGVVARIERAVGDRSVGVAVAQAPTGTTRASSPQGSGFRLVAGLLRRLAPLREAEVIVAPALTVASTDARWFAGDAAETLRFVPVRVSAGQVEGVHGVDERVAVADLPLAVTFYRSLLQGLAALD